MRTVTNYFIVNLAVADFLVILICLPPTVLWDVTDTWFMGTLACKIVLYLQVSIVYFDVTKYFYKIWFDTKPYCKCDSKTNLTKQCHWPFNRSLNANTNYHIIIIIFIVEYRYSKFIDGFQLNADNISCKIISIKGNCCGKFHDVVFHKLYCICLFQLKKKTVKSY